MRIPSASVVVPVPSERVFAFIRDMAKLKRWQPEVIDVRLLSGDGSATGSRWRLTVEDPARGRFELETWIVALTENERLAYAWQELRSMGEIEYRLKRSEPGTRIQSTAKFHLRGFGRIFTPFVKGAVTQKFASRLKLLCEQIEEEDGPLPEGKLASSSRFLDAAVSFTSEQIEAGQAIYTKQYLSIYDLLVLGLANRFVWRCPTQRILDLYYRHVTGNHLDVGVGTGYFLDRCKFPSAAPRVALMDLNPNSLEFCARRIARYRPERYCHNILEPITIDAPKFDSVGLSYLLHCVPGSITSKAVALDHLKPLMNPDGFCLEQPSCRTLFNGAGLRGARRTRSTQRASFRIGVTILLA